MAEILKNFAKATVSTGYNSAATSIVLTAGHGALLPAAPFRFVWWNSTDYPDPSDDPNVEIGYCTAKSTDTLTIERAPVGSSGVSEGGTAQNHNTGGKTYKILVGLTDGLWEENRKLYSNGAPFWNLKHRNIFQSNVTFGTGDNDVYTVPAGRKAIVVGIAFWNISGTSPNVVGKMKVSGTYYRATATTAITSGTATTIRGIIPLEAGDAFNLNFSAGITCNVILSIIEFDAVSPVTIARLLGTLINGDNTLYTCPAGYTACPLTLLDISKSGSTGVGTYVYENESGGTLTLVTNIVASGGSASANNKIGSNSASNNAVTSPSIPFSLEAGDFISINSGSNNANQAAFAIFFESPLPIT